MHSGTHIERDMIPRRKIRAYLTRVLGPAQKSSAGQDPIKVVSKAYSGFVHAASPHIMDMCGGNPPRFHLSGMLNTPCIQEYAHDILNYFYRGLLSAIVVGKAFGDASLVQSLDEYRFKFQEDSGRDFGAKRP